MIDWDSITKDENNPLGRLILGVNDQLRRLQPASPDHAAQTAVMTAPPPITPPPPLVQEQQPGGLNGQVQAPSPIDPPPPPVQGPPDPTLGGRAGQFFSGLGTMAHNMAYGDPQQAEAERSVIFGGNPDTSAFNQEPLRMDLGKWWNDTQQAWHDASQSTGPDAKVKMGQAAAQAALGFLGQGAAGATQLTKSALGAILQQTTQDDPVIQKVAQEQGPDAAFEASWRKAFDPEQGWAKDSSMPEVRFAHWYANLPGTKGAVEFGPFNFLPGAEATTVLRNGVRVTQASQAARIAKSLGGGARAQHAAEVAAKAGHVAMAGPFNLLKAPTPIVGGVLGAGAAAMDAAGHPDQSPEDTAKEIIGGGVLGAGAAYAGGRALRGGVRQPPYRLATTGASGRDVTIPSEGVAPDVTGTAPLPAPVSEMAGRKPAAGAAPGSEPVPNENNSLFGSDLPPDVSGPSRAPGTYVYEAASTTRGWQIFRHEVDANGELAGTPVKIGDPIRDSDRILNQNSSPDSGSNMVQRNPIEIATTYAALLNQHEQRFGHSENDPNKGIPPGFPAEYATERGPWNAPNIDGKIDRYGELPPITKQDQTRAYQIAATTDTEKLNQQIGQTQRMYHKMLANQDQGNAARTLSEARVLANAKTILQDAQEKSLEPFTGTLPPGYEDTAQRIATNMENGVLTSVTPESLKAEMARYYVQTRDPNLPPEQRANAQRWLDQNRRALQIYEQAVAQRAAAKDAPAEPTWYRYGMDYRPGSSSTLPPGYEPRSFQAHPEFRHGEVVYPRELTPKELADWQLTPIDSKTGKALRPPPAYADPNDAPSFTEPVEPAVRPLVQAEEDRARNFADTTSSDDWLIRERDKALADDPNTRLAPIIDRAIEMRREAEQPPATPLQNEPAQAPGEPLVFEQRPYHPLDELGNDLSATPEPGSHPVSESERTALIEGRLTSAMDAVDERVEALDNELTAYRAWKVYAPPTVKGWAKESIAELAASFGRDANQDEWWMGLGDRLYLNIDRIAKNNGGKSTGEMQDVWESGVNRTNVRIEKTIAAELRQATATQARLQETWDYANNYSNPIYKLSQEAADARYDQSLELPDFRGTPAAGELNDGAAPSATGTVGPENSATGTTPPGATTPPVDTVFRPGHSPSVSDDTAVTGHSSSPGAPQLDPEGRAKLGDETAAHLDDATDKLQAAMASGDQAAVDEALREQDALTHAVQAIDDPNRPVGRWEETDDTGAPADSGASEPGAAPGAQEVPGATEEARDSAGRSATATDLAVIRAGEQAAADPTRTPIEKKIIVAREASTHHVDLEGLQLGTPKFGILAHVLARVWEGKLTGLQGQGTAKMLMALEGLAGHDRGFLLADNTGVGKTRQMLAAADYFAKRGKSVLIATKSGVLGNSQTKHGAVGYWENPGNIAGSFAKDARDMGLTTRLVRPGDALEPGVIHLTTYDAIRLDASRGERFGLKPDDVVMLDESQVGKNVNPIEASQIANELFGTPTQAGLIDKVNGRVIFATATPFDKPEHWRYLQAMGLLKGRDIEQVMAELGMHKVKIEKTVGKGDSRRKLTGEDWRIKRGYDDQFYANLERLFTQMTAEGRMIRREISWDNVTVDYPRFEMPPEFESDMAALSSVAPQIRDHVSTVMTEWHKLPYAAETVGNLLRADPYRKVVLFIGRQNEAKFEAEVVTGHFPNGDPVKEIRQYPVPSLGSHFIPSPTERLRELLQTTAGLRESDIVEITGDSDKAGAMNAFQRTGEGSPRVVIATMEAGGTGINLDDVSRLDEPARARTVVVVTPHYSGQEDVQALGRVWRMTTSSYPEIKLLNSQVGNDPDRFGIMGKKLRTLGATLSGESIGRIAVDDIRPQALPKVPKELDTAWFDELAVRTRRPHNEQSLAYVAEDMTVNTKNGRMAFKAGDRVNIFATARPDGSAYGKVGIRSPNGNEAWVHLSTLSKVDPNAEARPLENGAPVGAAPVAGPLHVALQNHNSPAARTILETKSDYLPAIEKTIMQDFGGEIAGVSVDYTANHEEVVLGLKDGGSVRLRLNDDPPLPRVNPSDGRPATDFLAPDTVGATVGGVKIEKFPSLKFHEASFSPRWNEMKNALFAHLEDTGWDMVESEVRPWHFAETPNGEPVLIGGRMVAAEKPLEGRLEDLSNPPAERPSLPAGPTAATPDQPVSTAPVQTAAGPTEAPGGSGNPASNETPKSEPPAGGQPPTGGPPTDSTPPAGGEQPPSGGQPPIINTEPPLETPPEPPATHIPPTGYWGGDDDFLRAINDAVTQAVEELQPTVVTHAETLAKAAGVTEQEVLALADRMRAMDRGELATDVVAMKLAAKKIVQRIDAIRDQVADGTIPPAEGLSQEHAQELLGIRLAGGVANLSSEMGRGMNALQIVVGTADAWIRTRGGGAIDGTIRTRMEQLRQMLNKLQHGNKLSTGDEQTLQDIGAMFTNLGNKPADETPDLADFLLKQPMGEKLAGGAVVDKAIGKRGKSILENPNAKKAMEQANMDMANRIVELKIKIATSLDDPKAIRVMEQEQSKLMVDLAEIMRNQVDVSPTPDLTGAEAMNKLSKQQLKQIANELRKEAGVTGAMIETPAGIVKGIRDLDRAMHQAFGNRYELPAIDPATGEYKLQMGGKGESVGQQIMQARAEIYRARLIGNKDLEAQAIDRHDQLVTRFKREAEDAVQDRVNNEPSLTPQQKAEKISREMGAGMTNAAIRKLRDQYIGPDPVAVTLKKIYSQDPHAEQYKQSAAALKQLMQAGYRVQDGVKMIQDSIKALEGASAYNKQQMDAWKQRFHLSQVKRLYGKELTPGDMKAVQQMMAGIDWSDPRAVGKIARSMSQPDWRRQLVSGRTASLMSGPSTQIANVLGNSGMVVGAPIVRVGAAIGEDIRTLHGRLGPRQAFYSQAPAEIGGMIGAIPKAMHSFIETFKTGVSTHQHQDLPSAYASEIRWPVFSGLNYVFRLAMATDDFFREIGWGGAYAAEVEREAILTKMPNETLSAARDRITLNPLDHVKVVERASAEAERRVFNAPGGPLMQAINKARAANPAVNFMLPFFSTAASSTKVGFDLSPIGFVRGAREAKSGDLIAAADARGGAIIGSMVMLAGGGYAAANMLSGAGPSNPAARAALEDQGWQPFSLHVGDKWIPIQNVGPIAIPLVFAASLVEGVKEGSVSPEKATTYLTKFLIDQGQMFLQMSSMRGLQDVFRVLEDPQRWGPAWINNMTESLVPYNGTLKTITRMLDPSIKRPEGVIQNILANLPLLSQSIANDVTPLGETRQRQGGAVGALMPFKVTQDTPSPIYDEVNAVGAHPLGRPSSTIGSGPNSVKIAGALYQHYQELAGQYTKQAITTLTKNASYQEATQSEKGAMIDTWKEWARKAAREELGIHAGLPEVTGPQKYAGVTDPNLQQEIDSAVKAVNDAVRPSGTGVMPTDRQLQLAATYTDKGLLTPEFQSAQKALTEAKGTIAGDIRAAIQQPVANPTENQQRLQNAQQVQTQISQQPRYLVPGSTPADWDRWDKLISTWRSLPDKDPAKPYAPNPLKAKYADQVQGLISRMNSQRMQQELSSPDYQRHYGHGKGVDEATWSKMQNTPRYINPSTKQALGTPEQWAKWDVWLSQYNRLPQRDPLRYQYAGTAGQLRRALNPEYKALVPTSNFEQTYGVSSL